MSTEETASSGIRMLGIAVDDIQYSFDWGDSDTSACAAPSLEIGVEQKIDGNRGFVRLTLECTHAEQERRGHRLKARLVAAYEKIADSPSVPFERFLHVNAPAAMFAFARELVYSITSRSPGPPILLDPVNMHSLMRKGLRSFEEGKKQLDLSTGAAEPAPGQ